MEGIQSSLFVFFPYLFTATKSKILFSKSCPVMWRGAVAKWLETLGYSVAGSKRRKTGLVFHMLCPTYGQFLLPTVPTAIRPQVSPSYRDFCAHIHLILSYSNSCFLYWINAFLHYSTKFQPVILPDKKVRIISSQVFNFWFTRLILFW